MHLSNKSTHVLQVGSQSLHLSMPSCVIVTVISAGQVVRHLLSYRKWSITQLRQTSTSEHYKQGDLQSVHKLGICVVSPYILLGHLDRHVPFFVSVLINK